MRYKNIKTGAVVDSPFVINGEDWERVESDGLELSDLSKPELLNLISQKDKEIEELRAKIEPSESTEAEEDEYVEEEVDLEEMTNRELEEFAKENDIELTSDDKKNKDARIAAIVAAFE